MKRHQHPRRDRSRIRSCAGFNLLELIIALLIIAILLGLALPSYQRYLQRGQRAEAVRMLMAAAACQERVRAQAGYYDTTRCRGTFDSEHYAMRVEPAGETASTTFRLIAEPLFNLSHDSCGALSLDHTGSRGIAGDSEALVGCWGGR